jgi:hypothetical protein
MLPLVVPTKQELPCVRATSIVMSNPAAHAIATVTACAARFMLASSR